MIFYLFMIIIMPYMPNNADLDQILLSATLVAFVLCLLCSFYLFVYLYFIFVHAIVIVVAGTLSHRLKLDERRKKIDPYNQNSNVTHLVHSHVAVCQYPETWRHR